MSGIPEPPKALDHIALRTVQVPASKLYRISRCSSGEPYFGRTGANRFDDPTRAKNRRSFSSIVLPAS